MEIYGEVIGKGMGTRLAEVDAVEVLAVLLDEVDEGVTVCEGSVSGQRQIRRSTRELLTRRQRRTASCKCRRWSSGMGRGKPCRKDRRSRRERLLEE